MWNVERCFYKKYTGTASTVDNSEADPWGGNPTRLDLAPYIGCMIEIFGQRYRSTEKIFHFYATFLAFARII
jgi:hypothetical protein